MDLNILHSEEDLKIDFDIPKPICRCCLTTDRRMNDVVSYDSYFRELSGINVKNSDGLPQWICWECSSLLVKAVRFKYKMLRAHNMLHDYLTRCAPFPIDANDPELSKYACPQLGESEMLTFEMGGRGKTGFHEELQHEKLFASDAQFMLDVSAMDKVDDLVKEEDFSVDYDGEITLDEYRPDDNKLTDEDIKQLLEDTSTLEPKEDTEVKKKKKTKRKEDKVKKKKKNSEEPLELDPEEPRSSIRRTLELDPAKIRVITLNPQEQVKQREEESKSGFVLPFQCHLCYKGFNYEAKLENHMKKHSPSRGSFECKLCHMFLPTSYSFGVHNLIHTRRYECLECGRIMIDRRSILDHYRSQHEGLTTTYKCDLCGKVSTNSKTHRGHMRNHHSGDRPKCDQCGKSFVNKDALCEHLLIHQGVKNFECPTCGMRFRTRAQIKHHQLKHSDIKDYYCVECDVKFKSSHTLRQHLQKSLKHKDKRTFNFQCTRCDKRFETEAALRSHTLIQHEGVRGHRCTDCPAALASRSSLLKHIHSVHRGIKPALRHVCDTCGKAFRGKSVLTNHVRTHTGEKPFACATCGRGFSQRTAMLTHVKLVHMKMRRRHKMSASDGLPPYSCGVCSSLLLKSATFKRMCHNSYDLLNIAKLQQVLSTDYIKSLKITPLFSFTIKNTDIISIGVDTDEVVKKEEDWEVQIDHKVKTESRESSIDSDRDEPISELFKRTRILVESLPRKVTRSKTAEKTQRAKKTVLEKTKKVIKEKPPKKGVKEKKESKVKKEKVKKQKEKETGYEFPDGEVEVLMLSKEEQLEEIHARKSSVNYLSSFYKCELCFKGFISETTYKNHMVRHDPSSGALSCEICHIRVANNKLLRSHMIQLHERKYVCKLCNNVSKSKHSASEHSKWHSGQKFTCKFCDAVFSKKTSHLSHMRIHHPSEHVNCDVCGEAFIGEHGLRMHKKKAHKNMDTKTEPESETRCTNCKVQFQNADAFKRHTNNANGQCDVNFRYCAKCGESFSTELDLKKHLKQHAKEERKMKKKVVKCEECNLTFGVARSYSLHYQQVHLRLPPATYPCLSRPALAICDVCGKKCSSAAALRNHLRIHTGELPFQCSECPKRFRVNERLQIHRRIHTGERPVKCSYCPKAFRHKAQLIRHVRVHTGEKPYPCAHCGKSFSLNYTRKAHIRTVHMGLPSGAGGPLPDVFYGAPPSL